MIKKTFKSMLSLAKNSGAAGNGTENFWRQRLSALVLIPLSLYFVYLVKFCLINHDIRDIAKLFASPLPTIICVIFIYFGLYHGSLGMKEIIEDYIHCHIIKYCAIIFLNLLTILSGVCGIVALLVLHISQYNLN